MEITRDRKRENKLLKDLNIQNLEGVHLTDVLGCLRRAYYRQTSPMSPSRVMKLYNAIGIALQRRFYGRKNSSKTILVPVNGGVLVASPDNYHESADFKHTRKWVESEDLFDSWHGQGMFYAWLYGRDWWRFDVCHVGISRKKKGDGPYWAPDDPEECKAPALLCYHVQYTKEEIEETVRTVLDRAEYLFECLEIAQARSKAGKEGNPCIPLKEENNNCQYCDYKFICDLEE